MVDGVRHAGIFRDAAVGVVHLAGAFEESDVFQDGAVTDGAEDVGFFFLGQVDGFGVAAAFKIEHFAGSPGVLVVADERAVRVGAEGGFTGAGEAEEQGDVAVVAYVGGAVHRQGVFGAGGQHEIDHRENAFFDLAGIARSADQQLFFLDVDDGEIVLAGAVGSGVGFEAGYAEDGQCGLKCASSSREGRRNILLANWLLQGYSVTTRMRRRKSGLALAQAATSRTYMSFFLR